MLLDFTFSILEDFYQTIINNGYRIIRFVDYFKNDVDAKIVILRHDVDNKINNAYKIAALEKSIGIKASYYIRFRKDLFNEKIIQHIRAMGHEIGYHYEDLSLANGNYEKAIEMFKRNLEVFRQFYPVETICMHGSPFSKWDNRLIWERYNYRDFDVIGEPYFDVDYDKVLYLTDTGRRWDGVDISLRDKVKSKYDYCFKTTFDIMNALSNSKLPNQVMINIHPHSWNGNLLVWLKELIWQNIKNTGKRLLVRFGS